MPFIEQDSVANISKGGSLSQIYAANAKLVQIPLKILNCPSRRDGGPYTQPTNIFFNCDPTPLAAKGDYACNSGDTLFIDLTLFGTSGPSSLGEGDTTFMWPSPSNFTGVSFLRSQVRLVEISRGTSNTYLFGEKGMNPDLYTKNFNFGGSDNENMYTGFNSDNTRCTTTPPQKDTNGDLNYLYFFGSAHFGGLNMVRCDGSVQWVNYDIDSSVFRLSGRRND